MTPVMLEYEAMTLAALIALAAYSSEHLEVICMQDCTGVLPDDMAISHADILCLASELLPSELATAFHVVAIVER